MTGRQRNERLVLLTLLGSVALNYPLLALFSTGGLVLGMPVLYLYLFGVWVALIALAGIVIESRKGAPPQATDPVGGDRAPHA